MHINRFLPFALVYFFLNTIGLPLGLTYMSLLAPLFYWWILVKRKTDVLLWFIGLLMPYLLAHLLGDEVDVRVYLLSLVNLVLVYIFAQAFYTFLKCAGEPERVFRWIFLLNFICCLIAIPVYFSPYYSLLWDEQVLTAGVGALRRLRLFVYEPSYYALLYVPVFFFFLLEFCFRLNRIHGGLILLMLFLPFVLSFSIGVIGACLGAGLLTLLFQGRRLLAKARIFRLTMGGVMITAGIAFAVVVFFRQHPVMTRLRNIFSGADTSGKGRTTDAFLLAEKMIAGNHDFWGIGLGQIKLAGSDLIKNYYLYNLDITVTIPNAAAETLAIFGWSGLVLRIMIEIFLFIYTRVWTNYYRLLLFLFIFIYQFTGSFITNAAEYIIWILAFTNAFSRFDSATSFSEVPPASNVLPGV